MKFQSFVLKWIIFLVACAIFLIINSIPTPPQPPQAIYTGMNESDNY